MGSDQVSAVESSYSSPAETAEASLSWGDLLRRVLGLLTPLAMLAAAVHLALDVEVLLAWFPVCAGMSLLLQFAVAPVRSWWAYMLAVWPALTIIGCCLVIGVNNLLPHQAQLPIATLWWISTMAVMVLAIPANNQLWRFRACHPGQGPFRWQFPLRILLLQMVLLSLAMVIFRGARGVHYELFVYAAGSLFLLSGLAFSLFVANLKQRPSAGPRHPWDTPACSSPDPESTR